jgi:hypothetical protein
MGQQLQSRSKDSKSKRLLEHVWPRIAALHQKKKPRPSQLTRVTATKTCSNVKPTRLAFLRSDGREGRDQLVYIPAAAVGALDLGLVDLGDVVALGEFFVAVCAMKGVLRHGVTPR